MVVQEYISYIVKSVLTMIALCDSQRSVVNHAQ